MEEYQISQLASTVHAVDNKHEVYSDLIKQTVMDGDQVWCKRGNAIEELSPWNVLEAVINGDDEELKDRIEECLGAMISADGELYDVLQAISDDLAKDFIEGKVK